MDKEARAQRKREMKKRKDEARRKATALGRVSPPPPWFTQVTTPRNVVQPVSFGQRLPSPESLVVWGPLMYAQWEMPASLANAMRAQGQSVPPPIAGAMLIDTGATRTTIADDVAQDLGLKQIDIGKSYGVDGEARLPIYQATLQFSVVTPTGTHHAQQEMTVMAARKLNELFEKLATNTGAQLPRLVGLMGRDFLRNAVLVYNGPTGSYEVHLDPALMKAGKII